MDRERDAEAPLIRYARLRGGDRRTHQNVYARYYDDGGTCDRLMEGGRGFGGIVIEKSPSLALAIDYVRLTPHFYAPYAALSYESNAEACWASGRAPLFRDRVSLSLFCQELRSIDAPEDRRGRAESRLAGRFARFFSISGASSVRASVGSIERPGTAAPATRSIHIAGGIVANIRRDFRQGGVLRLQYERIRSEEPARGVPIDTADLYLRSIPRSILMKGSVRMPSGTGS